MIALILSDDADTAVVAAVAVRGEDHSILQGGAEELAMGEVYTPTS